MTEAIDSVLETAAAEGRNTLYEHEVYRILESLGIAVPRYAYIEELAEVTDELLSGFPRGRIVVKAVSTEILHKSRVGAVRTVERDPDEVKSACLAIASEVPDHPSFAKKPAIAGFLLSEFVGHSHELGQELLIGYRETEAFGPVLSLGKGGTDTEEFARHHTPPTTRMAPLSLEECGALIRECKVTSKYGGDARKGEFAELSEAIHKFSGIAFEYSSSSPRKPPFTISEFEVNPFVFDTAGRLVALDGLATFTRNAPVALAKTGPDTTNLDAFFKPEGVAVVGVSATDPSKLGNIIALLLHDLGRDDLYLVNPKGGEVTLREKTYPLYRTLTEVPEKVDLVVVNVPAAATPGVMEDAGKKKTRAAILIPGGFSELHGERTLEDRILESVKGTGMRLIGPNCMGVFYSADGEQKGINTWFIPKFKLEIVPQEKSNIAFLTQSGALGVTILDKLKYAMYPRVLVSYGNQIDVDGTDLLAYFDGDPSVEAISFYIEGFSRGAGRRFCEAAAKATKPVVVYKAGRTEAGSKAAASHTASMTGDYALSLAAFEQAGIIVAETLEELTDYIKTFALLSDKKVSGRRVAGIANAGFEGTSAADNLGGLVPASFSEDTSRRLREILPPMVGVNPFLDLTPMGNDELYEKCVETVLQDPGVDSLFVSIVPHTPMLHSRGREIEADQENVAARIIRQVKRCEKPVVLSVNAGTYRKLVETLEKGGVAVYPSAERAMKCLNVLVESKLS